MYVIAYVWFLRLLYFHYHKHKEYASTLEQMGLSVSGGQISKAISELYPDGCKNIDDGVLIRELFRHLKDA